MILGSKPLAEMSEEEMLAAIAELQSEREALRAEAIAKKAERASREARGEIVPREAGRAKRTTSDKDKLAAEMLKFLQGDD